ncbi:XRE family transcriptional regulator [Rheinheimera sediminis]|uniref:helix-turn-helix domain-containing protein n=1 Tax=Rheinheimera sp. YQF-1 TaxID=2499626 RepID=UPI000FD985E7|nr:helix-turn-helix transcriptional regulator [Rheinheimera sp. YQF-1]RVT45489.1 XRE family transcriptional regulator [Rheinheimera sp. YQF-1]
MDKATLDTLGRHIQSLRLARGLSLSQLAVDAGIAKSNLSRLEQGNGNPTLDTIWRLSLQLQVPFGNLIAPVSDLVGDCGVQVRLIDQGKDKPPVDAYWMSCAPFTERKAEAHAAGTVESITLISGQLEVGIEGNCKTLTAGQSHSFSADEPHLYRTGESWATALLTIVYRQSGEAL